MSKTEKDQLVQAMYDLFQSPNVSDSNWEPANLVDAIDRCADGLFAIAEAIKSKGDKEK